MFLERLTIFPATHPPHFCSKSEFQCAKESPWEACLKYGFLVLIQTIWVEPRSLHFYKHLKNSTVFANPIKVSLQPFLNFPYEKNLLGPSTNEWTN